ncbi:MAG: hypothetical protein ACRDKV_08665 [Solirubrobacterales bacterium]
MSTGSLAQIAEQLRSEDTVISRHVVEPTAEPVLGPLTAAGPRATGAPGDYSLVMESIREGYELHYGAPRILSGQDDDLALLAGDYLYALGLERLAALGDDEAVAELSDLIGLSATCHAEDTEAAVPALWLAAAVAIGCGGGEAHRAAKGAARGQSPGAAAALLDSARETAAAAGVEDALDHASESIDLAPPRPADSG